MNTANAPSDEPAAPTAPPTAISNQPDIDRPPYLPLELIEAVLITVPLQFPLSKIGKYSSQELKKAHEQCMAVLNVITASRCLAKVVAPRLSSGLGWILENAPLFGVGFVQQLYSRGYRFELDAVLCAIAFSNRADVLDWLTTEAQVEWPRWSSLEHGIVWIAIYAGSWDVLDWFARSGLSRFCDGNLSNAKLADLLTYDGQRPAQFVELWLRAKYDLQNDNVEQVLEAALEMGHVTVLDAWIERFEVKDGYDDRYCSIAVRTHGSVAPLLDWMLKHAFELANVAEVASKYGNLEALEWWKANKGRVEQQLQELYDHPSMYISNMSGPEGDAVEKEVRAARIDAVWTHLSRFGGDEGVVLRMVDKLQEIPADERMEIEPIWLSIRKREIFFCLELAEGNEHDHVLDWWRNNMELLPMPCSVRLVAAASARGDLKFLETWKDRWQKLGRSNIIYDCNRALCEATENGRIQVLEWWLTESGHGVQIKFDKERVKSAALASKRHKDLAGWWIKRTKGECKD